jgi:hypothetical protein
MANPLKAPGANRAPFLRAYSECVAVIATRELFALGMGGGGAGPRHGWHSVVGYIPRATAGGEGRRAAPFTAKNAGAACPFSESRYLHKG